MNDNNNVLVRVDAGGEIGAGHIMRCIALAQGFIKAGLHCIFVVSPQTEHFIKALPQFEFAYQVLKQESLASQEPSSCVNDEISQLLHLVKKYQAHFIVLDGYHFDLDYREQVYKAIPNLDFQTSAVTDCSYSSELPLLTQLPQVISIDDNLDHCCHFSDWIVNPSSTSEVKTQYIELKKSSSISFLAQPENILCGDNYRLLRQSFITDTSLLFAERNGILVTLGGADPKNYTKQVLQVLKKLTYLTMPVYVVVGVAFKAKEEVIDLLKSMPANFKLVYNPENIKDFFKRVKLAISAAGTSQFELYACRTPSILLISYDNQWFNSRNAENKAWCKVLDCREAFNSAELESSLLSVLNPDVLDNMYQNTPNKVVDGAYNCALAILRKNH
ncbi:UDP-2,4-diacetamido-2,4,6-trideoxy-beta-L-altropyranose hydrolase [Catenovulum maritimum]|uniref:Glycosyl transferase family 28 C-terminal domain-containing protein n=1 Tax=Catenovulum maritimum TaxID=1513271 RepID=A0A0J8GUZ9_9ALTE|nr:UDP-2,4-diacetamido-2,4,6-trideoxy-beta-L-altropyranose hydrolase [Catenovulum maritimum]KMT66610.1 hypothetical protein XM47_03530 [Catenovulum maritimum]